MTGTRRIHPAHAVLGMLAGCLVWLGAVPVSADEPHPPPANTAEHHKPLAQRPDDASVENAPGDDVSKVSQPGGAARPKAESGGGRDTGSGGAALCEGGGDPCNQTTTGFAVLGIEFFAESSTAPAMGGGSPTASPAPVLQTAPVDGIAAEAGTNPSSPVPPESSPAPSRPPTAGAVPPASDRPFGNKRFILLAVLLGLFGIGLTTLVLGAGNPGRAAARVAPARHRESAGRNDV
jgi:hypothetical protein